MPALAAVLFAAACGDDNPTAVDTTAKVRFFNATTGMTGSGGFTTNGQFASGSALAFGQSTQTCLTVNAGSTSFGFGAANPGGTGLDGLAIATLNNQNLPAGGNFTLVTAGSTTNATLYLLYNNFSGSLGSDEAAVRFVNLAHGTGASANIFNVVKGTLGSGSETIFATEVVVGAPTTFATVTSGSNAFTALIGHQLPTVTEISLDLQAGTVNTIAIVPGATSSGFQLVNIPSCS